MILKNLKDYIWYVLTAPTCAELIKRYRFAAQAYKVKAFCGWDWYKVANRLAQEAKADYHKYQKSIRIVYKDTPEQKIINQAKFEAAFAAEAERIKNDS